ncbi:MAG: DUF1028 domain-containing protein [Bacillota bacterium]
MDMQVDATYSIVAADRGKGEIGVAIATKRPAVGNRCIHAVAGIGAVASQSATNPYIPRQATELMRSGIGCSEIFELLAAQDSDIERRQVNLVRYSGDSFSFTGGHCQSYAGGIHGKSFAVAGNILVGPGVVEAMAGTFERSEGSLANRLLLALLAGEQMGGDKRGKQSAAILVAKVGWYPFVDFRIDDSDDPVNELNTLVQLWGEQVSKNRGELPDLGFRLLERGIIGADVSDVSFLMKELGYSEAPTSDRFTDELEAAVRLFQKDHRLRPTGIVDTDTVKHLRQVVAHRRIP